jgi:tetratricopeptide (TPR) repeat protein
LNHAFGFTYVESGDISKAKEVFEKMLSESEGKQARGHRSLALLHSYTGRYSKAIVHLKEAILLNRAANSKLSEFRDRLFLAAAYRAKGMDKALAEEMADVAGLEREFYIEPWFLLVCARMHIHMGALGPAERLLNLIAERRNEGNRADEAAYNLLKGEIELARKNYDEALSLLEIAYRLRSDNYYLGPLAHVSLLMGDLDGAIRRYQETISNKDFGWEGQETWVLAHYYLGRACEQKGEKEKAMESYGKFLEIWRMADPDLPALVDAKKRLAELSASS